MSRHPSYKPGVRSSDSSPYSSGEQFSSQIPANQHNAGKRMSDSRSRWFHQAGIDSTKILRHSLLGSNGSHLYNRSAPGRHERPESNQLWRSPIHQLPTRGIFQIQEVWIQTSSYLQSSIPDDVVEGRVPMEHVHSGVVRAPPVRTQQAPIHVQQGRSAQET